jgi:hypothetical protein
MASRTITLVIDDKQLELDVEPHNTIEDLENSLTQSPDINQMLI